MFIAESIPRYGAIDRSHPLARGLVACYSVLPGMASGDKWYDLAGNNHGTLTNGPVWLGDRLSFDGSNDYAIVPDRPVLRLTGDKTISLRVKTSSPGASYRTLVGKDRTLAITLKNSVLITYDWAGGGDRSSGVNVADGVPHYVAVSIQADVTNGSQLYVDGLPAGSAFTYATQNGGSNVSLMIGSATNSGGAPIAENVNGELGDIRIYNRALIASEIKSLHLDPLAIFNRIGTPIGRASSSPPAGNRRRRLIMGAAT